jgi:amino acid adenylation domain-containing protein
LASVAEGKMPEELERLVHEEINRPFDLSKGPLLRTTLVSLGEFDHALIVVMHHIISDEWSLQVFFRELKALYEEKSQGIPSQLPALPIQYGDYSAWQRQQVGRGSFAGQLEFWREQLRNLPSALELPMDKPRPAVPTFRGGASRRKVSSDLIGQIRGYAERRNVTLYMFFLASFEAVLGRYANREDFVVASPIAGRTRAETADMVGFFVNTLPLRANLSGDPKFETLLQRVRKTTLDAFANQDLPFDKVVEELHPARSLSHLPFTTVMFAIQNGSLDSFTLPGMEAEFVPVATDTSKFDLTLVVQDTREGVILHAEYNTDLFTGQTIERFLGHCEVLMAAAVRNDQQILSRLPLLSATEKETILGEWNRTQTDYPRTKSIQEVFEQQVAERPEAIALNFPQKTLTYRELNTQANQLARKLVAAGVTTDTPVGVCLPRSPEMIIAVLAVLKAGGAYVPLDAAYPQERLQFMLKDTQPPLVLTSGELAGKLPARSGTRTLFLDKAWDSIAAESGANLENKGNAENLAYIMYTSGSTGAPKGVSVTHRGITRLVLKSNYISLDHTDRIAQVSAFSFDAATFEIWGALLNGGQLVGISSDVALSPLDFAEELKKQNITAMFLTAALFNQVAAQVPDAFSRMRTLIAGGEALDPKWVRAVLKAGPPKNLLNGYGPTENTTFTCCELIRSVPEETTNVPIGKPISNTQVYIVDAQMNPVPVGVPGDLYTGGDGLARGYWKRPELTREKFVSNPFAADWGGSPLIYKTGDLARFLSDGRVEFLGRNDNQVKIRGFRIELGEIEAAMGKHSAIKECAVVVRGNSSEEKKIIAYYVSSKRPAPGTNELQKFLQHKLPPFMVPAAFVKLEAFPLTSNGKLDRAALPNPDGERPQQEKRYAGPTDDIEARLVEIWERILAVRPVGIKDRFFDLGGHSLLAVKVIAEIEKTFGQKLRVGMVFQYPTVEQLAILLREKRTERNPGSSLVEIQARGSRKPLFLVHGAGGGMFWGYVNLARHLGQDQPIYGFRADESVAGAITIEGIAAKYIADMRKVQPSGPYYLGGYCFGGNVA